MRLFDDPKFVNSIISAINEKKLVLFVGAGFSKLCGLPLWGDLANRLIDACITDEDIDLNFADRSLVTRDKDSKMLITIAYYLYESKGKVDTFYRYMVDYLSTFDNDSETNNRRNRLIDFIKKSGATVLTTNSDDVLHNCFNDQFIHYKVEDIEKYRIDNQRHLIHLHGYKSEMRTMVYTVKQYLERYANEGFKRTVKNIFNSDSTILFIGYGLNEMQLLDFLIDQSDTKKNRYVLDGFFSYEEPDYVAKQHYYTSFDLKLIGYIKDKNNYFALVDALEYLANEAQNKSKLKPENYLLADSMLITRPNPYIVNCFINTLMTLTDNEKKSVIKNIVNSPYVSSWAHYLLKNDDFLFFNINNCFNIYANSKEINSLDMFGLLFISEVYKKEKSTKIYPFVKKMILDIINNNNTIDILNKNEYFGRILLSLIFTEKKFINNRIMLDFILKEIIEKKTLRGWASIIIYEPFELIRANKISSLRINKAVIDHFSEDKYHSYDFEMYVTQIGNKLTARYQKEILNELTKRFKTISKRKYWSFGEVGSLIQLTHSGLNQRDDYDYIILFWYIESLNIAENSAIVRNFNLMINSKNEIELKLALYLLDSNFSLLRNDFFNLNFNPFDNWNLYSDLYVFIDHNWDDMSDEEKIKIKSNIDVMKITMISDFYNQACKLDLVKLIGSKYKEKEYQELAVIIEQTFGPDESDKYTQFSMPSLRNRRSWSSTYTITDDEEFKQKLTKMNIDEFFKSLSMELNDYQRHTVNTIYQEYFEKNSLVNWITGSSYENLKNVPIKYHHLILQYLMNSTNFTPFNIVSSSFNKFYEITEKQDRERLIKTFFSNLYYSYIKKVEMEEDFKSIYLFCKGLFEQNLTSIKGFNNSEKITIQTVLGNDVYQVISLLVRSAYKSQTKEVIQFLDSILKDLTVTPLMKSIICANMGYVWMIDCEWVKEKIDFFFDNDYNGQNISILSFTLSQFHHPEFIDYIYQKQLLDTIINSKDFDENKWVFIHNILANIMIYSDKEGILALIADTSNNFGGIHSYFSEASKRDNLSEIEKSINLICETFTIYQLKKENHNAALIVKLLAIYPKLNNSSFLWRFLMSLVPNHGTSYTKEINKQLKGMKIENNKLIEFVELYVSSLDDHFYYLQDIVTLIELPDWDGLEQKKDILINKIGKINPEFWRMYKGSKNDE
ncbi:MAG: SIR2 family protein [Candidatus Delongbacteria bacterium]|nr:SIR2 family protein [Candidatus Delongbacteria bacterium]